MNFGPWCKEADDIFKRETGCSWNDLCGDEDPLKRAFRRGDTPGEFVDWHIEKYDLARITE